MTRLIIGDLELIYCGRRGNTHIFETDLGDIRVLFAKHLEFDRRLFWNNSLRTDQVADLLVEWFAKEFGPRFLEKNW